VFVCGDGMSDSTVLIVGAGPTGMTLAVELARFGLCVRIVDKAEHMAQWSQALVLQARTLEQFQRYGIADEAVSRGRKLGKAQFWSEGRHIVSVELGPHIKSRYPYVLFLPQSETEAILNAKMESLGVKTERGVELVSLDQDADGVRYGLRRADGLEEHATAQWVVGCDGAHSAVRSLSGIRFKGESVGMSFLLGDVELQGEGVPDNSLAIHLHQGDVVFMGRLTDRLTRLIVALHRKQNTVEQQPKTITVQDLQSALNETGVKLTIKSADWMTPFRVSDRQAEHYRNKRVFLAGDASHIHSPVGGQGMNTGIQDAANLAWKLAAIEREADEHILDSYEQERSEVGRALLRRTGTGLKLATSANPLLQKVRDALAPIVVGFSAVQDAVARFISETAISYRDSPIVEDHGGDGTLRAGDRMPDLSLRSGTLLGDWTEAGPLAVMVNSSEDVAGVQVMLVESSELSEEGRKLLGDEPKVIVLRPDGYVGFRGGMGDLPTLDRYLQRHRWRPKAISPL
jgi:2-polyprenyl-6-methoxyphenol hydroxylase-like FAD-dependent oxidoreductase